MGTNVPLFSDPQSGKSSRQMSLEDVYLKYGVDFYPIIKEAHQKTLAEAAQEAPEFKDKMYWPQKMNRNMVGLIKQKMPDLVHDDEEGRAYIKLADNVRLYFKKLDKRHRPKNIPTGHVIELNSCQGHLFGYDITVLYAGFKLRTDKVWDAIDCFLVEMRTMKQCNWVSDLSDLSSRFGGLTITTPPTPPVQPIAPAQIQLKLKNQKGAGGKTAEQ